MTTATYTNPAGLSLTWCVCVPDAWHSPRAPPRRARRGRLLAPLDLRQESGTAPVTQSGPALLDQRSRGLCAGGAGAPTQGRGRRPRSHAEICARTCRHATGDAGPARGAGRPQDAAPVAAAPAPRQARAALPRQSRTASMLFVSHDLKEPRAGPKASEYTLAPGATKLPCILETKIISDVEGYFTCRVTTNVYDTATGRHLLVPQGSHGARQ